MLLSTLLHGLTSLPAEAERSISLLKLDSRQIKPNDLFLAKKGTDKDGRHYIDQAILNGAAAVLVEAENHDESVSYKQHIPIIPLPELKQKIALIAARFYDFPANKLRMLGVTGTNGKTSITHFFAEALQGLNQRCGIIGTLGSGFYCSLGEAGLTTPDAISLQATLADFVRHHAAAVAMEVSSHSIDQGRVNANSFELGIFTNLTQDHLDYHGSMAAYAAVKRRFLADFAIKHLIINADDSYGCQWAEELAESKSVYVYSKGDRKLPSGIPAIYAEHIKPSLTGVLAVIHSPWGSGDVHLPLMGQFNLSNALAVLTALCLYGLSFEQALLALSRLHPVPGRMQTAGGEDGMPLVVVDYAHTPDALDKVLQALRVHTDKKLICVFGCGGDRDKGKRPLMAKIAEKWADRVILTNDNPRHEDPQAIANDIMRGFNYPDRIQMELDRSKAIQKSIQSATDGDCVLIAGKGAERYQQIGDKRFAFDDTAEVMNYLGVGTRGSLLAQG